MPKPPYQGKPVTDTLGRTFASVKLAAAFFRLNRTTMTYHITRGNEIPDPESGKMVVVRRVK
jgi:hypothetical protein